MATTKEVRDRLGMNSSASSRRVWNAAIRSWIHGGNDLLDALGAASEAESRLRAAGQAEWNEAKESVERLRQARERVVGEIKAMLGKDSVQK